MPLWIGSMGRMIGLQIRGVNLLGGSGTLLSLHEAFLDQEYRTSPWRTTCTEAWELFKAREYKHLHVLLLNMLLLRSCLVVTTKSHTWHTIRLDNATCHWNKLPIKMVSQGRPTIVLFSYHSKMLHMHVTRGDRMHVTFCRRNVMHESKLIWVAASNCIKIQCIAATSHRAFTFVMWYCYKGTLQTVSYKSPATKEPL